MQKWDWKPNSLAVKEDPCPHIGDKEPKEEGQPWDLTKDKRKKDQ
jgi:hypothetical protein